jgi:hypothetical protein
MEQFDLFAQPGPVVTGYTRPKPFAFPSESWERMGHAPLFRVVCDMHRRRVVLGFAVHVSTRRAYSSSLLADVGRTGLYSLWCPHLLPTVYVPVFRALATGRVSASLV